MVFLWNHSAVNVIMKFLGERSDFYHLPWIELVQQTFQWKVCESVSFLGIYRNSWTFLRGKYHYFPMGFKFS